MALNTRLAQMRSGPPLLRAGNAVVGRIAFQSISLLWLNAPAFGLVVAGTVVPSRPGRAT